MNKNLIIVLAGGFLIAVIVAVLVQASMGSGKKKEKAAEAATKTVQIIVAAKNLPVGTQLSEENMKWQEWPQSGLFEGAIVKKDGKKMTELVSGRLRRSLNAGEPVVKTALVSEKDGNFVAASLRDGMRAVAIDANPVLLAGNLIKPGDYVDVILTYKSKVEYEGDDPTGKIKTMIEMNLDKMATETILQNVRVIAVGDKYKDAAAEAAAADPNAKPAKSSKKAPKVKTVTMEVDPRGAEVLALAKDMGKITLSLRKLGDDKYFDHDYSVITDERLTHIFDEIYGIAQDIQKTSGQNGNIVRIYNGYRQEQVSVVP
jgi:pilus assembly protein CpaB